MTDGASEAALQRAPARPVLPRGKLVAWVALVVVLGAVAYSANLAESGDPDRDLLYQWATAIGGVLNVFLEAGEEQGLVPDGWDSSRAAPFLANFAVVALAAPVVEELAFRGLGYAAVGSVLAPVWTVVVTGVAFGLAHGLVVALPVLSIFGMILAWLRWKTDSLYPPIVLHAVFNAAALIAAVTLGDAV